MKEIITIQLGQAGNQIGWRFWDAIDAEHRANGDAEADGTFFSRARGSGTRRARALLVDMEENVVSQVLRSPSAHLFGHSLSVTDVSGCGNNWAAGYAEYGPRHGPDVLDATRQLLEDCDSPQSFSLLHSVGGGTGSGLGSWVLEALADAYPELYRITTSVLPAAVDDVITSPYNAILTLAMLREHADCVFAVENDALAGHPIVAEYEAGKGGRGGSGNVPAASFTTAGAVRGAAATAVADSSGNVAVHSPVLAALERASTTLARAEQVLPPTGSSRGGRAAAGVRTGVGSVARGRGGSALASSTRPVVGGRDTAKGRSEDACTSRLAAGRTVASSAPGVAPRGGEDRGSPPRPTQAPPTPTPLRSGGAFDGMNEVVARMLVDLTASMRLHGSLNVDLNEIATTLVPFPHLQFLTTGLAAVPVRAGPAWSAPDTLIEGLVAGTFARRSALITADLARETHIALACIVRGADSIAGLADTVRRLRKDLRVVQWNEYGFKTGLCAVPPPWARASALTVSNNVCVRTPLARSYSRFLRLYRARAHVHHYLEHIEASYLVEAAHGVLGAVEEYEGLAAGGRR
jgi:hypothetical protein